MGVTFVDRKSTYPNRYKITNENGNSDYATLERADEPTVLGTPLNAETLNKLLNLKTTTVTLSASGWSDKTQTVSVSGVTAKNTVIVTHAPDSYSMYTGRGVRCVGQAAGKLTFQCDVVPETAVTANVAIFT